ncbi:MAG: ABC transporter permease [Natronomonas sp.]|uniref:ABC transporter permease n=1 Tax=Natronomonas sp. TaxID=2184060 RepID=UPI0028705614|nr:ABC transporter permease [Natronomonas sp.]MDR9430526.1 ABC transporter permease [Natronomonas sp.]
MSTIDRVRRNSRWLASRLLDASVAERFLIAVAAIVLSLVISSLVLVALGHDAGLFMYSLLYGAIGTPGQVAFTLRKATMLILAGIAVAVAFRANIFNIGVQGQMVVGAFTAAMVILGVAPHLPAGGPSGVVLVLLGLLAGVAGGAAYAAIPGLMKAYADANEVITTIMLNFIATGLLFVLVDGPLKAPGAPAPRTVIFPEYAGLPSLILDSRSFSVLGLGLALVTVVVVYVILTNTRFGYDLQTTGFQAAASAFSGVKPKRTIVTTMMFSGMIAGLTGGLYVVMIVGYFQDPGVFPTFGFDGIAVSLLAANNPLGAVPAGLLFGGLAASGQYVDVNLAVPKELVSGIIGLIVLFVATPELFRMAADRFIPGGDRE